MNSLFNNQPSEPYVSFEEMEQAFGTPTQRQDYYERPDERPSDSIDPSLTDPDHTANKPEELEAETVVDHEHAMRTGERIAHVIDTGIDFTLSNLVAKNGKPYRADEKSLQDISEAWGELSEEHQWNIGPEWTLALLYIIVYGPLVKQALDDRRFAELEAQNRRIEQRVENIENEVRMNPKPSTNDKPNNAASSPYHNQPAAGNEETAD